MNDLAAVGLAEATGAGARTRDLSELSSADAPQFGGKSASLGELLGAGIPVPGGFAVCAQAFLEHLQGAGIDAEAMAPGDARRAIAAAPMAAATAEEVRRRYLALARAGGEPAVAVRSSALGEDSEQATFAGQQESLLWVRGAGAVCDAVRACWASLYSDEAVSYRAHLGAAAPRRPAMGVCVQLMVDAAAAGVMFTCNPVSGDPSVVAINGSWGLGAAVVGGEVTPDDWLVSKVTGEVLRATISPKHLEYVPSAEGSGTVCREVEPPRAQAPCLDEDALGRLVALARTVERHFGCHQDIEWALDRAGELFVLQSRPVTALPQRPRTDPPTSALALVMAKFGAA